MPVQRILIVRLGAMGDILHALPAVASLRGAFPQAEITWAVHPKWRDLLENGGAADRLVFINRKSSASLREAARDLRAAPFDFAIDFQGLIQSALVARVARASARYGFDTALLREKAAALFYSARVPSSAPHVIERNLDLAAAAGAASRALVFPLPPGREEGALPQKPFVIAAPLAGWPAKQWPLENYVPLARALEQRAGLSLVLNSSPAQEPLLRQVAGATVHISSLAGLIHATRRAAAVLGLDSGPMHLGAALGRPGVALFGPTDPERNGPHSPRFRVLRAPGTSTTYQRSADIHPSMREISVEQVVGALESSLSAQPAPPGNR
jgi:heptosyltransferase I